MKLSTYCQISEAKSEIISPVSTVPVDRWINGSFEQWTLQIAISLYGVGLGFLTLTWIISICSCCADTLCGKNIFLVLTHFITLACTYLPLVRDISFYF